MTFSEPTSADNTFTPWDRDTLAHSVAHHFRETVARHGQRLALKDGAVALTYDELDRASNQLAQEILARRGPGSEPVALLMKHGVAVIVAILAAVKAGKIYLPLDPSYSPTLLQQIMTEAQPGLLLAESGYRFQAERLSQGQVPLHLVGELEVTSKAPDPALPLTPETPFSLMYTSGSTGRPKGVLHSHRNLLHVTVTNSNRLQITPADRHTHLLSSSFGASVSNIFGALLNGASLFPFDLRRQGVERLAQWLRAEAITVYHSVPTVFRHLLQALPPDASFPEMRVIKLGGERVPKHDVDLFQRHFPPSCILHTTMGTSEAHIVGWYMLRGDTPFDRPLVPAGYPEEDVEILFLDSQGNEQALGHVGEIAVRSRYLFSGYWRNPERTAAVFVDELAQGEKRVYLTGDLGRLDGDGCLEHQGRKDFQVKIRGQRVDLAAVEAALLDLPQIQEAAVVAQETEGRDTRLVAYVVPAPQVTLAGGQLRQALALLLPRHAIPAYFVAMERLPLLPFGKINRKALPKPDWQRPELDTTYVAPANELERQLATLWAELLEVSRVGVHDNFYDLGGHSLMAAQLANRLRDQLGVELTPGDLLRAPTVAELAQLVSSPRESAAGEQALAQALRRLGPM